MYEFWGLFAMVYVRLLLQRSPKLVNFQQESPQALMASAVDGDGKDLLMVPATYQIFITYTKRLLER
jgi:hypothetical protein